MQVWSGGPTLGLGMVERASLSSGSGQKALSAVWEWSGAPPGGPGVVGKPFLRSGSGQEALS